MLSSNRSNTQPNLLASPSHSLLTLVSSTPPSAPTSSFPDPFFPNPNNFVINYERNPNGVLTGMLVSTNITNRGGAGEVCAQLRYGDVTANATHSLVFHMDNGENVTFGSYFPGNTGLGITQFYWTVRAALQGDISMGTTAVTRSTSIPEFSTSTPTLLIISLAIMSLVVLGFTLNKEVPTSQTNE